jgi:hypothetical protein
MKVYKESFDVNPRQGGTFQVEITGEVWPCDYDLSIEEVVVRAVEVDGDGYRVLTDLPLPEGEELEEMIELWYRGWVEEPFAQCE